MNFAANIASTQPARMPFIPLSATASVCGTCSNWKGPRERNGRKSFICMEGTQGACRQGMADRDSECAPRTLTTPLSNGDCPNWQFAAH